MLKEFISDAIDQSSPARIISKIVTLSRGKIFVGGHLLESPKVSIFGIGKCVSGMACALEKAIGPARFSKGTILIPDGYSTETPVTTTILIGDHPYVTDRNLKITRLFTKNLKNCPKDVSLLFLLSGGAGSLLFEPRPGLSLGKALHISNLLYTSGADITEMNAVRKHISLHKGGGIAKAVFPRKLVSLIMSDVIGDPLDVIGCGPTAPDPTTYLDAAKITQKYLSHDPISMDVHKWLLKALQNRITETLKDTSPVFDSVQNYVIPCNSVVNRLESILKNLGFPFLRGPDLINNTQETAKDFCHQVLQHDGSFVASLGEPLPRFANYKFLGGRLSEFALCAALELDGRKDVQICTMATDGVDGTAASAGAYVSGRSCQAMRKKGIDPPDCLQKGQSFEALKTIGAIIPRQRTNVNHCDIFLGFHGKLPGEKKYSENSQEMTYDFPFN